MTTLEPNVTQELVWQEIAHRIDATADGLIAQVELPRLFIKAFDGQQWSLAAWQAECSKLQLGRLPRELREVWGPQFEVAGMSTGFAAAAMGVSRDADRKADQRSRKSQTSPQNPTEPIDNEPEFLDEEPLDELKPGGIPETEPSLDDRLAAEERTFSNPYVAAGMIIANCKATVVRAMTFNYIVPDNPDEDPTKILLRDSRELRKQLSLLEQKIKDAQ